MVSSSSKIILLVLLLLFGFQLTSNAWASVEEVIELDVSKPTKASAKPDTALPSRNIHKSMPFKLGFEFQESSGLCPWALANNHFQKKPIIFIAEKNTKKRLWKLVIDTTDIEFVTEPYSDTERPTLERCMDSILIAVNALQELFAQQASVTFAFWRDTMESSLHEQGYSLGHFFGGFGLVENQLLMRPKHTWNPELSPQVTFQHPLEYTIPLYFGLFGFDSRSMIPFSASLPFREALLAAQKAGDSEKFHQILGGYSKKLSGLLFLHALTMTQMVPIEDCEDKEFLEETLGAFEKYHQIDPKMRLTLMSRRPFSSMLKDLELNIDYPAVFKQALSHNNNFMVFFDVPKLFSKVNYAEQFFDAHSGQVKPLRNFLTIFKPDFVDKNREILLKLLDNGIITTAMLRNFKEDILTNDLQPVVNLSSGYFAEAIKTVALPKKRYTLRVDTPEVQYLPSAVDALSPPWFLDLENSMGALNQEMTEEEKEYGEAIIEVRAIKSVNSWFLKKANLPSDVSGEFLTKATPQLKEQAVKLFKFLKKFGTEKDFADISLGMTFAVLKH